MRKKLDAALWFFTPWILIGGAILLLNILNIFVFPPLARRPFEAVEIPPHQSFINLTLYSIVLLGFVFFIVGLILAIKTLKKKGEKDHESQKREYGKKILLVFGIIFFILGFGIIFISLGLGPLLDSLLTL